MKKVIPVAIPRGEIGSDGRLTPEGLKQAKRELLDHMGLEEDERREFEEQMETMLGEGPFLAVSARSITKCLERVELVLEALPQGVLALAQSIDAPLHVFELGSVDAKMKIARALLESARATLDEVMKCHFQNQTEPEKDISNLS